MSPPLHGYHNHPAGARARQTPGTEVLTLGFASMFSLRSHSSLRVYLAFPVMASMDPLLICCLIAQISRKKGSPTVSWGREEGQVSKPDLVAVAPDSGAAGTGGDRLCTDTEGERKPRVPPCAGKQGWPAPGAESPGGCPVPSPTSIALRLLGSFQTRGNVTAQLGERL